MRILTSLLLLATAAGFASAQETHSITPQDLWAMKRLSSPSVSPDGKAAVLVVTEWSVEKAKSTSNLWLVDLASGATRRLTTAKASDNSPEWSPDGHRIAFISKRGEDEVPSLYTIPTDGGEAEKVLELPYAVGTPKWLPDSASLIVSTTVIPELAGTLSKADLAAMKKEAKHRRESKITAKTTEDRAFRYWDTWLTDKLANRLLRVDLASKEIKDLTPGYNRLFSLSGDVHYDVSPDGTQLVLDLNSTPPPYQQDLNPDVYLLPTDGSGTLTNLTPENPASDEAATFSPDGKSVLFSRHQITYYCGESNRLWRHDLANHKNSPVSAGLDYSFENSRYSKDGQTIWMTLEDKGRVPLFRMKPDGSGLEAVYRTGSSNSLRQAGSNIVFLNNTSTRPDELFTLDTATGAVRQLTHFNEALLAKINFGSMEEYWFDGAAGDKVMGIVYYPPGFDATKSYPLVELMHGGPHTMVADNWSYRWNAHVFAACGYVVTWVNRHGSTGFGEKFAMSINGEWGEKPLQDILKSIDVLRAQHPNIDEKRMAAAGGSYGGYMAAWVAGHTDRFACLIDHAGVNDFVTQYGADVTNYGFTHVLGGTPWSNTEAMQRNNPMAYAKNFKSPMLVIHGELDYRVPYVNGTALYGVYQSMGLPSRLVIFPNENHWVLSPQNSLRWNWEVQTWLSRYLGGNPTLSEPHFED
jgi:dipeptidyl aminopeptidase/acylaminoacyl peptidase